MKAILLVPLLVCVFFANSSLYAENKTLGEKLDRVIKKTTDKARDVKEKVKHNAHKVKKNAKKSVKHHAHKLKKKAAHRAKKSAKKVKIK